MNFEDLEQTVYNEFLVETLSAMLRQVYSSKLHNFTNLTPNVSQ